MTAYAEVIGDPIAQSKSPAIHTFWLGKLGIDAEYRAAHVRADELADYLASRRADEAWRGCNVTMPHKQAVMAHLARLHPLAAEQVHGLSDAFLADKKCFHEHALDLIEFLADSPLVAHNAQFDFGFLNYEFTVCGHPEVVLDRMIDTLVLARRRHPGAKHSLDALCMRYGIDRSHRVRHGALLDAELLAQVYVERTGGRQIGLALAADVGGRASPDVAVFRPRQREFRPPRPHSASAEELARHKAFLEAFDSPLWAH